MSDYVLIERSEIDNMENRFHTAVIWRHLGVYKKTNPLVQKCIDSGTRPKSDGWPCEYENVPYYRITPIYVSHD